jgi:hypothetical protein
VLWKYVHDEIVRSPSGGSQVNSVWTKILENVHVLFFHRFTDDFTAFRPDAIKSVKKIFEKGDYAEIYGWLQFVLRHQPPPGFAQQIENRLRYCRAPYRILAGDVLCPIGSDVEAATVGKALRYLGLPRWLVAASI